MRKSKARLVIELVGPSEEIDNTLENIRQCIRIGVTANYPEPVRITPILRNRKPKDAKPERKARKANSQQEPEAPNRLTEMHGSLDPS